MKKKSKSHPADARRPVVSRQSETSSSVDLIDLAQQRAEETPVVDQAHAFDDDGKPLVETWDHTVEQNAAVMIGVAGATKEFEGAAREIGAARQEQMAKEQLAKANLPALEAARNHEVDAMDRMHLFSSSITVLSSPMRETVAWIAKPLLAVGDTAVLATSAYDMNGNWLMSILLGLGFGIAAVAAGTKLGEAIGSQHRGETRGLKPEGLPAKWYPLFQRPVGAPKRTATRSLYMGTAGLLVLMVTAVWFKGANAGTLYGLAGALFAAASIPGSAAVTAWAVDPALGEKEDLHADVASARSKVEELNRPFEEAAAAKERADHAAWSGYQRAMSTAVTLMSIADRRVGAPALYGYGTNKDAADDIKALTAALEQLFTLLPTELSTRLGEAYVPVLTQLRVAVPAAAESALSTDVVEDDDKGADVDEAEPETEPRFRSAPDLDLTVARTNGSTPKATTAN